MNAGRAIVAGVLAGAAMTAAARLLRLAGLEVHFAMWLGTVFVQPPERAPGWCAS